MRNAGRALLVAAALGVVLSAGTVEAARCALEGKLCTPPGAPGNNPPCCGPEQTGGVVLTCPPAGPTKNHCTRVEGGPPTTTPTTSPATTTVPGCIATVGLLCDYPGQGARQCCPGLECRDTGHHTCQPTTTSSTATPPTTVTTSTAPATTSTTIPGPGTIRYATGRDLRITLARKQRCKWIDGRTATQPERALMYLRGVAKLLPEGLLYAKYHPTCRKGGGIGKSESDLETEDTRLRVYYVDPKRNSVWAVLGNNGCPDYEHVQDLGERLQTCSTQHDAAKVACATSPYLTPDLLDWTDMRVEHGRCERGARAPLVVPSGPEDLVAARQGTLNYSLPLPPLTPSQRARVQAALDRLLELHHHSDHAYCVGTPGPPPGSVQAAALAVINAVPIPEWQHALLLDFTPMRDEGSSGWTRQQHCDLKQLQGLALAFWRRCFTLPDRQVWRCATPTRVTHETWHRIGALRNTTRVRINDHVPELKLFGEVPSSAKEVQLTSQPARTPAEWLACQTGEQPGCRLPWVPDPATWRIEAS